MFALGLGLLAFAVTLPGCATGPNPKPNPCIGTAKDRETMPCTCPATLNPGCMPWITDAKKPKKTCYRMTLGCDEIDWDATPDSAGVLHGHCRKSDDTPRAIPCDDVPKPDGGSR